MIEYYKTFDGELKQVDDITDYTWINLIDPSEEERDRIIDAVGIEPSFLAAALDEEEPSYIDTEDGQTAVVVDIPVKEPDPDDDDRMKYYTVPFVGILKDNLLITVCTKDTPIIRAFSGGLVKNVDTKFRARLLTQFFYKISQTYLVYLKQIDKISTEIEQQLQKSMKNKELFHMMEIEKSLVYFSTSLGASEVTLRKILSGRSIKLHEEDHDLLEDVLIEIRQAIEMCSIYRDILAGEMDAFASIISNNLNIVMKVLTSITILMAIPNIVSGIYGMNVDGLPVPSFWFPLLTIVILITICIVLLRRNKLL